MMKTKIFHEDVFYEFFKPYRHPGAKNDIWGAIGLETFGEDLDTARKHPPEFLWTVVSGESGEWILPGYRFVNRLCYLVAAVPNQDASLEFRVSNDASSLSDKNLRRQMTRLRRAIQPLS
jgi:hypothetical protein